MLDSDQVRERIGATSYAPDDRAAFYNDLGVTAGALAREGKIVLVAATASRRSYRDSARAAAPAFLEVYVHAELAECEARDLKGNYARARAGKAPTLPGIGEPYEMPRAPDVIANGGYDDAAVVKVVDAIDSIQQSRTAGS
jgi:adenylylsulfate kinase